MFRSALFALKVAAGGVVLGIAFALVLIRGAGATGLGFVSGQGCAAPDGSISLVWTVSNPTDSAYAVDSSSLVIPSVIPPHGSVSATAVLPSSAAGSTQWADLSGRFLAHVGDEYYGTPGVTE